MIAEALLGALAVYELSVQRRRGRAYTALARERAAVARAEARLTGERLRLAREWARDDFEAEFRRWERSR